MAQNTYAVSWFKGKELNLVFGLQLSMARIVSGHQARLGMDTRAVLLLLGLLLGGSTTAGVSCWGWGIFTSRGSHGSMDPSLGAKGGKRGFFLVLPAGNPVSSSLLNPAQFVSSCMWVCALLISGNSSSLVQISICAVVSRVQ